MSTKNVKKKQSGNQNSKIKDPSLIKVATPMIFLPTISPRTKNHVPQNVDNTKNHEIKQQKDVDFTQLLFIKNAPLQSLPQLQYFLHVFDQSQKYKK